ncbi:MAG: hypothetical protein U1F43_24795 [Myxococcota bacterium]
MTTPALALACAVALGLAHADGVGTARAAAPDEVVPAGSELVIELVDWSDKVAGPYLGKRCVAMNELWPAGLSGTLHEGSVRCGDDVFRATAIKVRITKMGKVLDDGRYAGEAIATGTDVVVVGIRDLVSPPLGLGARCRVAQRPAKKVGPAHFKAMLRCDGVTYEARAVALLLLDPVPAQELTLSSPELGCADGRWRDCVKASNHHFDADDGPLLERACDADDPHACRDLARWLAAYQRETRREIELQERACQLGSQLACFERARARNLSDEMPGWCQDGFAPACRFLQLRDAPRKKDSEHWRLAACAADPGCGSY